jgi:hypothetical protein
VQGKWYKIDRIHNSLLVPFKKILEIITFDEKSYDENTLNTLLVKLQNGIPIEMRYNEENFEESLKEYVKEDGVIVKKIRFDKDRISSLYDNNDRTMIEKLVFHLVWYTREPQWFIDIVDFGGDKCEFVIEECIDGCELEEDDVDEDETGILLIKYTLDIDGDYEINSARYNLIHRLSVNNDYDNFHEESCTELCIQAEEKDEKNFICKEQYMGASDNQSLKDDEFTLGEVYNIWINEYEAEVVEKKGLWESFKDLVYRSWNVVTGFFGW